MHLEGFVDFPPGRYTDEDARREEESMHTWLRGVLSAFLLFSSATRTHDSPNAPTRSGIMVCGILAVGYRPGAVRSPFGTELGIERRVLITNCRALDSREHVRALHETPVILGPVDRTHIAIAFPILVRGAASLREARMWLIGLASPVQKHHRSAI